MTNRKIALDTAKLLGFRTGAAGAKLGSKTGVVNKTT